jgi:hypothetical protein
VQINNLDTCCEQVGRRGKDCEQEVAEKFCALFVVYLSAGTATIVVSRRLREIGV